MNKSKGAEKARERTLLSLTELSRGRDNPEDYHHKRVEDDKADNEHEGNDYEARDELNEKLRGLGIAGGDEGGNGRLTRIRILGRDAEDNLLERFAREEVGHRAGDARRNDERDNGTRYNCDEPRRGLTEASAKAEDKSKEHRQKKEAEYSEGDIRADRARGGERRYIFGQRSSIHFVNPFLIFKYFTGYLYNSTLFIICQGKQKKEEATASPHISYFIIGKHRLSIGFF